MKKKSLTQYVKEKVYEDFFAQMGEQQKNEILATAILHVVVTSLPTHDRLQMYDLLSSQNHESFFRVAKTKIPDFEKKLISEIAEMIQE